MCKDEGTRGGDGTAEVGREEVGCASGSAVGSVDDKVGEGDKNDAKESSLQPGRRLRGGKVTDGRKLDVWRHDVMRQDGRRLDVRRWGGRQ